MATFSLAALTRDAPAAGAHRHTLPRVNLLPPEIAERTRFRRLQYGMGGALLASAGLVLALYAVAAANVREAEEDVALARSEQARLTGDAAGYRDVTEVYRRAATSQALLGDAMGQEVRYSGLLTDLSVTVPTNVWIKSLTYRQAPAVTTTPGQLPGIGSVSVVGMALGHDDVAGWLESLAGQKGYADPTFSSSAVKVLAGRDAVEFTSTATLSTDALSRGVTVAGG